MLILWRSLCSNLSVRKTRTHTCRRENHNCEKCGKAPSSKPHVKNYINIVHSDGALKEKKLACQDCEKAHMKKVLPVKHIRLIHAQMFENNFLHMRLHAGET